MEEIEENIRKEIKHSFNHPNDMRRRVLKKQEFELMIIPSLITLDLDLLYLDESSLPFLLNLATLRCPVKDLLHLIIQVVIRRFSLSFF